MNNQTPAPDGTENTESKRSKVKLFILIGTFLMIAGLLICTISLISVDFNVRALFMPQGEYVKHSYTMSGNLRELEVDVSNREVIIEPADVSFVYLTYSETEWDNLSISEYDGILRVTSPTWSFKDVFFLRFNHIFDREPLVIKLPRNAYGAKISIETSNKPISATDIQASSLSLISSNDKIKLTRAMVTGDIYVDSSNDDLVIAGASGKSLSAETSNGEISLDRVTAQGDITTSTSNDSIALTGCTARRIEADTSNAEIRLERSAALDSIFMDTSNAPINVVLSGDVSQYSFECDTSNGIVNVGSNARRDSFIWNSGPARFEAYTSNADIIIR